MNMLLVALIGALVLLLFMAVSFVACAVAENETPGWRLGYLGLAAWSAISFCAIWAALP